MEAIFTDFGELRAWRGINGKPVALAHYPQSILLENSTLHRKTGKGICIFATPPHYDDPELYQIEHWASAIPELAELQRNRDAFVGDDDAAGNLAPDTSYIG
ncbi:hypothetical protein [Thiococcus pfennigii]|uniref:hypothetical protein n=1 Tax=Thiococcus pfennigii TaxID=1057 RepID=UPI001902D950|nr:hypothetical protein [Thiococcus pfennigii]